MSGEQNKKAAGTPAAFLVLWNRQKLLSGQLPEDATVELRPGFFGMLT